MGCHAPNGLCCTTTGLPQRWSRSLMGHPMAFSIGFLDGPVDSVESNLNVCHALIRLS